MPDRVFQPGFRLSALDCGVLVVGIAATIAVWPYAWWLGATIALVVGHFFLFCNVVRMARPLELAWSGVFLTLVGSTVLLKWQTWPVTLAGTLLVTAAVVTAEMRKPSYHGVLWQRINPRLPEWWAEHGSGH